MTVCTMGVKTKMNISNAVGMITPEENAKSVIDQLGWEGETLGHWKHYILNKSLDNPFSAYFIRRINIRRAAALMKQK